MGKKGLTEISSLFSLFSEGCHRPCFNRHLCKDHGQEHHRFYSSYQNYSEADREEYRRQYHAQRGSAFGFSGKLLKKDEIVGHWLNCLGKNEGACVDMGPLDWILRQLREEKLRLFPHWAVGAASNMKPIVDPTTFERYTRITVDPKSATERDVWTILYGPRDYSGAVWKKCVTSDDGAVIDPELVDSRATFNPKYRGLTIAECISKFKSSPDQPEAPPAASPPYFPPVMQQSQCRLWQSVIDKCMCTADDPVFGRHILWAYEENGNFGKSVLANYLRIRRGAIIVGGGLSRDVMHQIRTEIDQTGQNPPIVIFDLTRAVASTEAPWAAIEAIKNGVVPTTKYQSTTIHFARPWVLVLANVAAPGVGVEISADRIVEVELRAFADGLEDEVSVFAALRFVAPIVEPPQLPL